MDKALLDFGKFVIFAGAITAITYSVSTTILALA